MIKKINYIFISFLVLSLLSIVSFLSVQQIKYNVDPHHWGLFLSVVNNLNNGFPPYSYAFVTYGILTPYILLIFSKIFGLNLLTFAAVTSLFYCIGIFYLFLIIYKEFNSFIKAFLSLLLCVSFHSVVIYPWPNYFAFAFILGGLYHYRFNSNKFLSGLLFSLSILCRENLFIVYILFFFVIICVCLVERKSILSIFNKHITLLLGFFLPLMLFFAFIILNDLFHYWYINSVIIPKIYLNVIFPHVVGLKGVLYFFSVLFDRVSTFDFRWIFIAFILFFNFIYIILYYLKSELIVKSIFALSISILSLLLVTSMLHIPEIFRFATASLLGLITIFYFNNFTSYFSVLSFSFVFVFSFYSNSGNYFSDPRVFFDHSLYPSSVSSFFKGVRWNNNVNVYYSNIDSEIKAIKSSKCEISFIRNLSRDGFITALSGLKKYQIGEYYEFPFIEEYRKDINITKLFNERKFILIYEVNSINDLKIPDGFKIYNTFTIPKMNFFVEGNFLVILSPSDC